MHVSRAKIDYELKHHSRALSLFRLLANTIMRIWGVFVWTDDKMVLFSSLGRRYNDSPKAIYEYMISQPRFRDYKFVWALEEMDTEIPGNPLKVKADSIRYFMLSLKAHYWITSVNIERSLRYKKKDCI